MRQNTETAIYLLGVLALAALAAAVFHGCAADVPSTTEQMTQVVTWCAARAALKNCPVLGEGVGR